MTRPAVSPALQGRSGPLRRHIAVVTHDALTPKMAGPAIRAWQIASALSAEHEVQLVTTSKADLDEPRFVVRSVGDHELPELERVVRRARVPGLAGPPAAFLLDRRQGAGRRRLRPAPPRAAGAGPGRGRPAAVALASQGATAVLNEQLLRGDFLLCASEKQRDFWLGQLAALGRVNPRTYDEDETMRSLHRRRAVRHPRGAAGARPAPAIKGVVPGIGPDDKVILWGGGIYNWFDPLTLLRAVDRLRAPPSRTSACSSWA